MASFKIVLDERVELKNKKFNLSVRMVNDRDVMYLKITPVTKSYYQQVFVKNNVNDEEMVEFRDKCRQFRERCEKTFLQLQPFDKKKFRDIVYSTEAVIDKRKLESLNLSDLFTRFGEKKDTIKLKTKGMYQTTSACLTTYKPNVSVFDITPGFLTKFESDKRNSGLSPATVSAYLRCLRGVLNYFMFEEKLIPSSYKYPFGKGGFSIKRYQNCKLVLKNDEIQKIADFKDFENKEQEYARDIWLMLYRINGINFADLFRMKWSNIKGQYLTFTRMKTETTRKNNIKEIVVPISDKLQTLIDKVGNRNSPYILGLINEGETEQSFRNKKDWQLQKLNSNLKFLTEKLKLTIPLKLKMARDSYATSLKRANIPTSQIGEMMGHSNSVVTEHYLATLDIEKTWEINESLY